MTRPLAALLLVAAIVCSVVVAPAHGDSVAGRSAPNVRRESTEKRAPIRLAITVDDLPGGGPEVLNYSHVQMVKDIIAALQAHGVPHPAGFIVGEMLATRPARFEALEAWVQAGFLVGNHTYSHDKIAELGLSRFMDDIVKNRAVVDPLEKRLAQDRSYFRFPYLEEGATAKERSALWQLLQRQRYTLVRASVAFGDTNWADAYLRCSDKHDEDSLAALDRSYVASAIKQLQWSVAAAGDVLGHPIPHVLLVHVNAPTAKNLDRLLHAYAAQGVQFIELEEAMREPAYSAYYDVPGGDLLHEASASLGRPHPEELVEFYGLLDRLCR